MTIFEMIDLAKSGSRKIFVVVSKPGSCAASTIATIAKLLPLVIRFIIAMPPVANENNPMMNLTHVSN